MVAAKSRKIFFVMASGGHDTDRHYYETIERKRTTQELAGFLASSEIEILDKNYYGGPFAIWGAIPGTSNIRTWTNMEPGDYVLVYRKGKIIFGAEIAFKVQNEKLAESFWQRDDKGNTWEYIFLMVNPEKVDVPIEVLNKYLGYVAHYHPQGFMAIDQAKTDRLLAQYGDILSALKKMEKGEKLEEVSEAAQHEVIPVIEEKIARAETEHDEMQWRLIRLGKKAKVDVWVPMNDQGKKYEGNEFRAHVLKDFQETLDVPQYVKNIDVVWKYGYSIKSAFEIEHSTSVYSGILRLSDLRALTPNSIYPLFIVASRKRKNKVFFELKRPTFDNPYLKLKEAIGFLSYDKVRELDESLKDRDANLTTEFLLKESERVI
jgi:hypothetical protein